MLAKIWQGAWNAGDGGDIPASKLKAISHAKLIALYTDDTFVESLDLAHIGAVLT